MAVYPISEGKPEMQENPYKDAADVAVEQLCYLAEERQVGDPELADRLWEIARGLELAKYAPQT